VRRVERPSGAARLSAVRASGVPDAEAASSDKGQLARCLACLPVPRGCAQGSLLCLLLIAWGESLLLDLPQDVVVETIFGAGRRAGRSRAVPRTMAMPVREGCPMAP
jgi:hypothetical protein